jgi:conjugative relaxase-like TrwC/TraI family protein
MLNIGRMAPGRADYYLTAVARGGGEGVEGYYLSRGEEPGRWLGHGADTLGLSGEVTAEQLRAVLDARHPTSGQQLSAHPARRVPGFDHTFRAPKSVSLLWALGDRATAAEVTAAHDAAVDAAIGYLQRAAGFTRRGAGGAETVPVDGFVAAAFRHRTSRADDPLLHTHVLVANLARTHDDGVWRTLDSRKLFAHAKTAGVLCQAHLRHELTRRLGVAWQPVVNGVADIDGVDRRLIETFSRRRAQIIELMRRGANRRPERRRPPRSPGPSSPDCGSGWSSAGVALAARAALELEASAGIRSTTLARLLGQLNDHRDGSPLQPGSVLVVDEAGMVGTRQLARLLDHADAQQVKVVLVGDPHQLPEIDAGGLFRALTTRLPAIELTDNRRQQHTWEQAALDELRHGEVDAALATYRQHGRIHAADTAEQVRATLVDDWWATARDDLPGSVMIALRRHDVADLNHRARAAMLTAGRLTGPALHAGEHELRAGDRIVCLRNAPKLGVVNGTRATITHIHPTTRTVAAVDDRGVKLTLPGGYLDAGHVTHGYAITGHKAQGLTCDHTYTLGTETVYREWGYVAMSRGRLTNQLYHGPVDVGDDGQHRHVHHDEDVPELASRLRRTRAATPVTPEVVELAAQWRHIDAELAAIDTPWLTQQLTLRDQLHAQQATLVDTAADLTRRIDAPRTTLQRLRQRDTINKLRDQLEATLQRQAAVADRLDRLEHDLSGRPDRDQLDALRLRRTELGDQLRHIASARVRSCRHHPPAYLTAALGDPPIAGPPRGRWLVTAIDIEEHRLRWDITDPRQALGTQAATRTQHSDRRRIHSQIELTLAELRDDPPVRSIGAIRR